MDVELIKKVCQKILDDDFPLKPLPRDLYWRINQYQPLYKCEHMSFSINDIQICFIKQPFASDNAYQIYVFIEDLLINRFSYNEIGVMTVRKLFDRWFVQIKDSIEQAELSVQKFLEE